MTLWRELLLHVIPAKAGIHLRRGFPGPLLSQGWHEDTFTFLCAGE
jgi:hypothetical protein